MCIYCLPWSCLNSDITKILIYRYENIYLYLYI